MRRVLPRQRLRARAGRRAAMRTSSRIRDDKKTRWIELRIPVTEGKRYRVGDLRRSPATRSSRPRRCRPLFKTEDGRLLQPEADPRRAREGARELYGAGGYFEFTGYPDFKFRDEPDPTEPAAPAALAPAVGRAAGPPIVDVTMRIAGRQAVTSSTASPSSATRRRATTSSVARCGCTRTASSTPRR